MLYNDWATFLLHWHSDYPNLTSLLTLYLVHVEWQVIYFMTEQRVIVDNTTVVSKHKHTRVNGFLTSAILLVFTEKEYIFCLIILCHSSPELLPLKRDM